MTQRRRRVWRALLCPLMLQLVLFGRLCLPASCSGGFGEVDAKAGVVNLSALVAALQSQADKLRSDLSLIIKAARFVEPEPNDRHSTEELAVSPEYQSKFMR